MGVGGAGPLRIRLLGGVELRAADVRLPPLGSARAETLLAYLLLHRDAPQPRQRVAYTLWPDSSDAQARTNLRHVLHTLRRAVPQSERWIEITARTLQWRPQAPWSLDVAAFEDAVARAGDADGEAVTAALEEAVAAYGGDLLAGVYEDWVLAERERLRDLFSEALERLARARAEAGATEQAVRHAERLVRHDPLREDAHRLLIELHAECGDATRAARAFHACVAALEQGLGVAPSNATRSLYERLGAGDAFATAPAALVGRRQERAQLTALWAAAAGGRAQLAVITGEPGVGKTRLAEELRTSCGAASATGRAYPGEGAPAYAPTVAWLRAPAVAPRVRALEPARRAELARLLPELAAGAPAPARGDEAEQRTRLFDAVAAALVAARSPLLLLLEDLQWCDTPTLQLVRHLLRTASGAPLLVLATARWEEVEPRHPAAELVVDLQADGRAAVLPLDRLDAADTRRLAEQVAGRVLMEAEAEALYEDSEGNALFVVEAVRAGLPPRRQGPTPRVQAVIAARLAQLSPDAAALAGLAAAIGREFPAVLLAAAADVPEDAVDEALDELWRRGIVRARPADRYDFSHERIREAAYRSVSPARRRRHHRRLAEALERLHGGDPRVAGRLAAHLERAGRTREAVTWYGRAAEVAQGVSAHEQAARLLERALGLLATLPVTPEHRRAELALLAALPAPLVAAEGYGSSRLAAVHARATDAAGALGSAVPAPVVRSLALAALTRDDFAATRRSALVLREEAERADDGVLAVEAEYLLGVAAFWEGKPAEAAAHLQAAIARYRPAQRQTHLVHYAQDPVVVCQARLAYTHWLLGDDERAVESRDAALRLARDGGHAYSEAVARIFTGLLALERGDLEHTGAALLAAEGPAQIRLPAEALRGYVSVAQGDGARGLARIRRALDAPAASERPAPGFRVMLTRILLAASDRAGAADLAVATADDLLATGGAARLWEAEARRVRARWLEASGDAAGARAERARALAAARRQGARAIERRIAEERSRNGATATVASMEAADGDQ